MMNAGSGSVVELTLNAGCGGGTLTPGGDN